MIPSTSTWIFPSSTTASEGITRALLTSIRGGGAAAAVSSRSMRFEIVTIFPEFFTSIFENGILRRALAEGLVTVEVHDLRAFTHDRHRTVDDRPFGGGEGMVLKPEPLAEALASLGIAPKAERQEGPQAAESIPSEGGGGFNPRVTQSMSMGALAPEVVSSGNSPPPSRSALGAIPSEASASASGSGFSTIPSPPPKGRSSTVR